MGVLRHGGLHQEGLPSDPADRGGLQPGRKHSVQVPGGEPEQPGEGPLLRQRVPGLQRSQVGGRPVSPPSAGATTRNHTIRDPQTLTLDPEAAGPLASAMHNEPLVECYQTVSRTMLYLYI